MIIHVGHLVKKTTLGMGLIVLSRFKQSLSLPRCLAYYSILNFSIPFSAVPLLRPAQLPALASPSSHIVHMDVDVVAAVAVDVAVAVADVVAGAAVVAAVG